MTIDEQVTAMCNAMGVCDRIFVSPVPVIYTRFLARFVELFMAFVPFALYEVCTYKCFGFVINND